MATILRGKNTGADKSAGGEMNNSYTIPKEIKWSVADFKDLYFTMCEFKKRFMERKSNWSLISETEKKKS